MDQTAAGRRRLSPNRSVVLDLVYYSRTVPLFPAERQFALAEVTAARRQTRTRVSWSAVFLKAYGLVAARVPQLRQAYQKFPWPHLYQFPHNVGMVAVSREHQGEDRLCFGRFIKPEEQSLVALQNELDRYQQGPIETTFSRQVSVSRLPWPIRRLMMFCGLHLSGGRRAKRLGTFGMSALAGQGVINRFHPTFLTTSLSYGPVDDDGHALITLICDHRILDGALAARALVDLERTLQTTILEELRSLRRLQCVA